MCIIGVFFTPYVGRVQLLSEDVEFGGTGDHVCGCAEAFVPRPQGVSQSTLLLAHASLMTLAWGLLIPAGITLPLFWRKALPN